MKGCRTKAKRRKEKSLCGLAPLRAKNKMSRRRKVQACFYALIIRRGGRAPCTRKNSALGIKKRMAPRNAAGQAAKAQRREGAKKKSLCGLAALREDKKAS
jgi:hypothetical protein